MSVNKTVFLENLNVYFKFINKIIDYPLSEQDINDFVFCKENLTQWNF